MTGKDDAQEDEAAAPFAPGRRLRRSDWLDLGLRELAANGPGKIGIERLCRVAGRTRGSFYHHFEDHDAFIDAMLRRWADRQTLSVLAEVEAAPPEERSGMLVLASLKMDHRLDGALRAYARTHAGAAARLAEVDAARIAYLERLHRDLHKVPRGAARALARLEYAAFIGGLVVWPEGDAVQHQVQANRFQRLVRLAVAADLTFDVEEREAPKTSRPGARDDMRIEDLVAAALRAQEGKG
ncbi:TetR/AcrR family transcriptional regulator [Rhodovulum sp. DZ06]|uniref:TetR/AcrR family transcriptional regulator n=1 Tax=Rhodovulum sp. DZ06 TaxID=3425126 RepID=UPI003D342CA8